MHSAAHCPCYICPSSLSIKMLTKLTKDVTCIAKRFIYLFRQIIKTEFPYRRECWLASSYNLMFIYHCQMNSLIQVKVKDNFMNIISLSKVEHILTTQWAAVRMWLFDIIVFLLLSFQLQIKSKQSHQTSLFWTANDVW